MGFPPIEPAAGERYICGPEWSGPSAAVKTQPRNRAGGTKELACGFDKSFWDGGGGWMNCVGGKAEWVDGWMDAGG